ncbi:hypothetical protein AC579_4470 [Pseudocercospora musae]|uniref:Uncharacterized protein n=1 Tax=Pseudocercospora musae TaxID=113226 RepID=A0A139GTT0_9PEZI|nr:hypothetical protein AC579_4470 [Pseudocercospora musae]
MVTPEYILGQAPWPNGVAFRQRRMAKIVGSSPIGVAKRYHFAFAVLVAVCSSRRRCCVAIMGFMAF